MLLLVSSNKATLIVLSVAVETDSLATAMDWAIGSFCAKSEVVFKTIKHKNREKIDFNDFIFLDFSSKVGAKPFG